MEEAIELVRWIANNVECESVLLYPEPQWYVFAKPLLDKISSLFDLEECDIETVLKEEQGKMGGKEGHA